MERRGMIEMEKEDWMLLAFCVGFAIAMVVNACL